MAIALNRSGLLYWVVTGHDLDGSYRWRRFVANVAEQTHWTKQGWKTRRRPAKCNRTGFDWIWVGILSATERRIIKP